MNVEARKEEHVRICLKGDCVESGSPLFEEVYLIHEALPEVNLDEVDTATEFLGHEFSAPIIITAMTGGFPLAEKINGAIAEVVEELGLGMGVGSQRAAIEREELKRTYSIAREKAPNAFIIANIGASQLGLGYGREELVKAIDMVRADALAIHLNPLQECLQVEGEPKYKGILNKIKEYSGYLPVPVIAKETGAGISKEVAESLVKAGVAAIDVGGLGGTNFAIIEGLRAKERGKKLYEVMGFTFSNWGIPTAISIIEVRTVTPTLPLVATGGIRSGLDIAKAIALGADMVGIGLPVIRALMKDGREGLRELINRYILELKIAMFLTGSSKLSDLRKKPLVLSPRIVSWMEQRGLKLRR
ncbi:MAG: type 2 isopentenyl-diphosphate Delta-isomerase [Thermofilum sp. ex4484_15]|nr:MAG: type 2 isopentenyl-diphosphate Delta-isomerase [Thermofilum sp. ex4484_15]